MLNRLNLSAQLPCWFPESIERTIEEEAANGEKKELVCNKIPIRDAMHVRHARLHIRTLIPGKGEAQARLEMALVVIEPMHASTKNTQWQRVRLRLT